MQQSQEVIDEGLGSSVIGKQLEEDDSLMDVSQLNA